MTCGSLRPSWTLVFLTNVNFMFKYRITRSIKNCQALRTASFKKNYNDIHLGQVGAEDRGRTGTVSPPQDFKSCASACSATSAAE